MIGGINADMEMPMVARQVKSLNNIEGLDHRAVKRITKPMLGFKSFQSAKNILAGIELMHMIRKGQLAQMICLLPTNFVLWQEKSALDSLLRQNRSLQVTEKVLIDPASLRSVLEASRADA